MPDIDDVADVIEELEGVAEQRIRAETRYEQEMLGLEKLGYTTTDDSGKAIPKLGAKVDTRTESLKEEFDDFIEDYNELFE